MEDPTNDHISISLSTESVNLYVVCCYASQAHCYQHPQQDVAHHHDQDLREEGGEEEGRGERGRSEGGRREREVKEEEERKGGERGR